MIRDVADSLTDQDPGVLRPWLATDWTANDSGTEYTVDLRSDLTFSDGTVSGEHGVGALKREWARRERGPEVVALQRAVRRVFDPQGILNPATAL